MKAGSIVHMNRFAVAAFLLALLMTSCVKDLSFEAVEPTIEQQAMASGTFALCSATVTYPGKITVEVEWSISQDMSTPYRQTMENNGGSSYSTMLSGLSKHTTYYYRVTVSNSYIYHSSTIGQFTTIGNDVPILSTSEVESIGCFGAVGGGNVIFDGGADVTERGICWCTDHNPTIDGSHHSNGMGLGEFIATITGLEANTTYYVRAYAINSYGSGYGEEVSFTTHAFEDAIAGVFSVSSDNRVYFSKGNLQYQASTNIWRFAENQYDHIGESNSNISSSYNGWIDLFGWGTSGWNSGANCYQPWSTSTTYSDYYPGGSYDNNLTGDYSNADWGIYNAISNGGDVKGLWRTLSAAEWEFVFNIRNTNSGIRFAKARVNNTNGVILLPDDWSSSTYSLDSVNCNNARFSCNIVSASQWIILEDTGAIFLPVTGERVGTSVRSVDSWGHYYSTTYHVSNCAYLMSVFESGLNPNNVGHRYVGWAVRLVCPVEN